MPKVFNYVWLVPLLPLLAAIVTPLVRRTLSKDAHWPAVLAAGASFLVAALVLLSSFGVGDWSAVKPVTIIADWITLGDFHTSISLKIDPLSALFLATVSGVGLMVVIFSVGYMHDEDDRGYARYFSFVSLFLFSMCMLVLADNFLTMYVFWEGVGLCSYLLVGFWFVKPSAADAAKKAFLVNRIGDIGLAIGLLAMWTTFGTLDYARVFAVARDTGLWGENVTYGVLAVICLCIFWGCTGKSAQLPLYVWLPDAMEGPTPVSALIHAATMVTAGIYLVARSTPLFFPGATGAWPAEWALTPPDVVALVGGITALFAATIALSQYDMKRILAYSTVSQLGYMFLALGVGATGAAVFHVHTHAFFKAALFLGAGVVMHATHGELDIRKIGGLRGQLPTTYMVFLIAAAALSGVPLTAGFFSKDAIIHGAFGRDTLLGILAVATALITAFYTFRLVFCAFWGKERLPAELKGHVHAPNNWMTFPIVVLGVFSIVGGWYGIGGEHGLGALGAFLNAPAAGPGTDPIIPVVNGPQVEAHGHGLGALSVMLISTVAAIGGIWAAYNVFVVRRSGPVWPADNDEIRTALENKYWVDEAYQWLIVTPLEKLANILRIFDRVVVDGVVYIAGALPTAAGYIVRPFQSGYLQSYGLYMAGGLALIGLLVLRRIQ